VTSLLARQIDERFSNAADFERFFLSEEGKKLRLQERAKDQQIARNPKESCRTNLFFGFFFDGTKNQYVNAEPTKHSNVARLYDCYPGKSVPDVLPKSTDWQNSPSDYDHFFRVYVPGVSSPFKQVNDSGKGYDEAFGGAAGAFAERRIIWALVQAVNNVHRYLLGAPLIAQSEMDGLLRNVVLNKQSRALMVGNPWQSEPVHSLASSLRARRVFEDILQRLHKAVSRHWPDPTTGRVGKIAPAIVKTIYISTFGFSRGATQARAFTNWLQSLCKLDAQLAGRPSMTLGGFHVEFDFLGLFDTVASVGAANTVGILNGHAAWADAEDSLRIPAGVKCLHLVAAHELRRSFPLDAVSVGDFAPEECKEIVVPGVHSDLGGGYCPLEQGRGTNPDGDDMLSRIPLLMMYREARLNGVPLKLELAGPSAQAKFHLTVGTITAFNAYIETCTKTSGPIHEIMREQARKQIEWRLARRVSGKNPLQSSASFLRACTFDQNDLYSAGREFEEEIAAFNAWLKEKGSSFRPMSQQAGFDNEHLSEWEEIASWWQKGVMPSAEVMGFFDNYVHDSRAWFKLIPGNPDNEAKMHMLLASWVERQKQARINKAMQAQFHGRGNSMTGPANDGLSEEQSRAADEYAKTGKIPSMITEGREPFSSSWKSWGLSGRAGYLRFRKIYGGSDFQLLSSLPADQATDVFAASEGQQT
jgi:hypothetical protein